MIVLSVIFLCLCIIIYLPVSVDINTNVFLKGLKFNQIPNMQNVCKIKFGGITVYKINRFIKTQKSNKKNKKKKTNKRVNVMEFINRLIDRSWVAELRLNLGFNLSNSIANSYIMAGINTLLCLFINSKADNFNLKKLYYQTYISEKMLNMNLKCIIRTSIANTIIALLKSRNEYKKENNRYG